MKVAAIMTADPTTIQAGASLDEAMELMDGNRLRHLPVLDGEELAGVISDRDLLEATGWLPAGVRQALDSPEGTVRDFMRSPAMTVDPQDGVAELASKLIDRHIGCLPVMRAGKMAGLVSEIDILRGYLEACRAGRIARASDPPIAEYMSEDVVSISPETPVEEALEAMKTEGFRHLPIVADGLLIGLLSDRDVRYAIGSGRFGITPVREIMSENLVTIGPEDRLSAAAELMVLERIGAIPVTDGGRVVGILTIPDVMGPAVVSLQQPPAPPEE